MFDVDFARLPAPAYEAGAEERSAEIALDTLVGQSAADDGPMTRLVRIVVAAGIGQLIRLAADPTVLGVAVALPAMVAGFFLIAAAQRGWKTEPGWAHHARVHEEAAIGLLDPVTAAAVRRRLDHVRGSVKWQAVHMYVPRCAQDGPHYQLCCRSGTLKRHGRVLVIIGEHLFSGEVPLALPAMAHEGRHLVGWRDLATPLAALADSAGMVMAGWAVPWPWVVVAVAGIHLGYVGAMWAVEVSSDLGAARETSASAMIATVEHKSRVKATMAQPRGWKRLVSGLVTVVAGPTHPPLGLRRWALRTLAR